MKRTKPKSRTAIALRKQQKYAAIEREREVDQAKVMDRPPNAIAPGAFSLRTYARA